MEMYQGRSDMEAFAQASQGYLRIYADGHYHGVKLTRDRCARLIKELAQEWELLRDSES